MSFPEQDPDEQANISGADLAILIDVLNAAKQRIKELEADNQRLTGMHEAATNALKMALEELGSPSPSVFGPVPTDPRRFGIIRCFVCGAENGHGGLPCPQLGATS